MTAVARPAPPIRRASNRSIVLPPYARDLIALRDAGEHPPLVVVVLAREFAPHRQFRALATRLNAPPPLMALADEVEARMLSWFVVRGLGVVICMPARYRPRELLLLELIAQVASEAAYVTLYRGGDPADIESFERDATDRLADYREQHPQRCYPSGWTDEKQRAYAARLARYMSEGAT